MKKLILSICVLIALFNYCTSSYLSYNNYSNLYSNSMTFLSPEYIIYHHKEDSSKLFFHINSSKVLYARKGSGANYFGKINFHYIIYDANDTKNILDSASFYIIDSVKEISSKKIIGNISFPYKMGNNSLMKIYCKDVNKDFEIEKHILIDKTLKNRSQFFMITDSLNKAYFSHNSMDYKSTILESVLNKNRNLFIKQYNRDFSLSSPPFTAGSQSTFNYKPDIYKYNTFNDKGKVKIKVPDSGFAVFQIDTSSNIGYSVFNFDEYFPKVRTTEMMIRSIRYICSSTEYKKLLNSDFPKSDIDNFWLSRTGSKDRAREIIRRYYNRVENANIHFNSYKEGWKTDRGMISIIFGNPGLINKYKDSEIWIYGDKNNLNSLTFRFTKEDNPFSDNDYRLIRSVSYKSHWYKAVDSWRSGRAYWIQ
jgi:GWxTD domain-containing protein